MTINITYSKQNVFDQVALTTDYVGAKNTEDKDAYERIPTTDADREQLDRFYDEAVARMCETLRSFQPTLFTNKMFMINDGSADPTHAIMFTASGVQLEVSRSFDTSLMKSIQTYLTGYLVMEVQAKWYVVTNKKEAAEYAAQSTLMLEKAKQELFFKKKPSRPRYDSSDTGSEGSGTNVTLPTQTLPTVDTQTSSLRVSDEFKAAPLWTGPKHGETAIILSGYEVVRSSLNNQN